jgi:uncharacterized protein
VGRPLIVHAAELLRRPGSEREVRVEVTLDELGVHDDRFEPDRTVEVVLHLESLSDGIVVRGEVGVHWRGTCRRCLQPVSGHESAQVHELYQQTITDPDAFPITGDQLDLGPMVREHALLVVPDGPLCRPDCAGLCPHCGIDRNEHTCTCVVERVDDRWAALDALRSTLGADDVAEATPSEEWPSGD